MNLESQVLGSGNLVLGPRCQFSDPGLLSYYHKVWQKVITKCDNYYQEVRKGFAILNLSIFVVTKSYYVINCLKIKGDTICKTKCIGIATLKEGLTDNLLPLKLRGKKYKFADFANEAKQNEYKVPWQVI